MTVYPGYMRHVWPAILALLVVILPSAAFTACVEPYDGPIKSFTAEKDKLTKGQATKLTAVFDMGVGVIDNDIGEVQTGQVIDTAMLMSDTTYTLTVTDENGNPYEKKLEVKAFDPAKITSFKADKVVVPGQSTTMTATFTGVKGTVDNGIGEVKSGVPFSTGVLDKTKSYKLTVTNEAGDPVTADAEAEAAVTPVIDKFEAPGDTVGRYAPTMLTAVFTGGKGVVDQDVGPIVSNTPTKTKDVPAAGTTWTLTVTNGLGESVKKSITVKTKKELFVADNVQDVLVFDVDANGDVEPKRIVVTEKSYFGILGIGIANDELYVGNEGGTTSITTFGLADGFRPPYGDGGGDTRLKRRISGSSTTIGGTQVFSVSGTELFVSDKSNTIKVWNTTDTGNIAPKRTISGAGIANSLGTWVDNDELYVGNYNNGGAGTIAVYPVAASGNAKPTRTIDAGDGAEITGVTVAGDELFAISKAGSVTVFNKKTGAKLRKIGGANTKMKELYQCSVADGELFCSEFQDGLVVVFDVNANGNVAPKRTITGDKTYIAAPTGTIVF